MRLTRRAACALPWVAVVLFAANASAAGRLSSRVRDAASRARAGERLLVWIEFRDKGAAAKATPPADLVSARSLRRRAKVLPAGRLVDARDLPVDEGYVRRVAERVQAVRQRSKWFNRVSAWATVDEIEAVSRLDCVRSIDLVWRAGRGGPPAIESAPPPPTRRRPPGKPHSLDYGLSFPQVDLIRVPQLHDRGLHGQGVLIGHFDDGYSSLAHEAFATLRVAAQRDFVDHDADPVTGTPLLGGHGVVTLSVLAGYAPGKLIGTAFEAEYVLARTENDLSETPIEEDNWVAAIEWADSLGIDVASTSVGYNVYTPPYPSWTWEDMDGNTTVITRAADLAAARGILVMNAVGNEGVDASHNTLVAPADGDSVIAVGGVQIDGARYGNGSVGPAASDPPRIKPDVMALGVHVYFAGTGGTSDYGFSSGTSFSCPLAAGAAALLLVAHPQATPMQVRDALRDTASRAANPDNLFGWGVVDATAALERLGLAVERTTWTDLKSRYR